MTSRRALAEFLFAVAYTALGGLVAIAVLAPQLRAADAHVARLVGHEHIIARRCTFTPDGGATCPAGVFHVDRVVK